MTLVAPAAFVGLTVSIPNPVAADVDVTAPKYHGIVVDGVADEWSGITGTTIALIRGWPR